MEIVAQTPDGMWRIEEEIRDRDSYLEGDRSVSWRVVHAPSQEAIHTCGYSEISNSRGESRYGARSIQFSADNLAVEVTEDHGDITRIVLEWPVLQHRNKEEYERKKAQRERIEAEWRAARALRR
jgi:hypothetical protein